MDKQAIYDTLGRAYFSEDCDEREVIAHLSMVAGDRSLIVDVGASLGQYTGALANTVRESELYAIEADPVRVEELERNCQRWASASGNTIKPLHLAVSDESGEVSYFVTNSTVSGGLSAHPTETSVEWSEIRLRATTLDEMFPDRAPDLVKIDVEGAELRVLQGAVGILRKGETTFLVELHEWASPAGDAKQVRQLMQRAGYLHASFFGMSLFTTSRLLWARLTLNELLHVRRSVGKIKRRLGRLLGRARR